MSMIDDALDFAQNSKLSPVAFLFKDAGDQIFNIQGTGLSAMQVDTVDDENHEWANDVTQFPVEGATDISDNIKQKPDSLTLTCFISNAPISGVIDNITNFADRALNGRNRTQAAFNQLKALRDLKIPVTVTTRYRQYVNMGIVRVQIVRRPEDGESLVFTIEFRQINITRTQTVKLPPGMGRKNAQSDAASKKRAGANTAAGKSTGLKTEPAAAPTPVKKSILTALPSLLGG